MTPAGAPIVLTADRTLIAAHSLLLDGMFMASQTTIAPCWLIAPLFLPPVKHKNGRALIAPLGLRRVEAALRRDGFAPEEIAIADEQHLADVLGPRTTWIGLSSGEPLGFGMSSTTMTRVAGGMIYPQRLFMELLERVHALRATRCPAAALVLGGPGAWQLAADDARRQELGFAHLLLGYAEGEIGALARRLAAGEALPPVIQMAGPSPEQIPPVCGATTFGAIELSRGCGWGCAFCTMARQPMQHLPPETILADAETNLRGGQRHLTLLSEDLLRYGAEGLHCRPAHLLDLLRKLRELPGVGLLQADHANIISVAQYEAAALAELHFLLSGGKQRYPWLNIGIETASGSLLERLGGRAKMGGVSADDWADFCAAQLERLIAAGFVPLVSLVLATPEERREDLEKTKQWLRRWQGRRILIFPVFYAPLQEPAVRQPRVTSEHWQIMHEAYEYNFRWLPIVYEDSMRAGGITLARRLAIQALGRANIWLWRRWLRQRQREAAAGEHQQLGTSQ